MYVLMECGVCFDPLGARCTRCPKCRGVACAGCARRWALEAEPRCALCNAALAPAELAVMFPGSWIRGALRDRTAARTLETERARLGDVQDAPLFVLAMWLRAADTLARDVVARPPDPVYSTLYESVQAVRKQLRSAFYFFGDAGQIALSEIYLDALLRVRYNYQEKIDRRATIYIRVDWLATFHGFTMPLIRALAHMDPRLEPKLHIVQIQNSHTRQLYGDMNLGVFDLRDSYTEAIALLPIAAAAASPAAAATGPAEPDPAQRGFFCPAPACDGFVVNGRCGGCGARVCTRCRELVANPAGRELVANPAGRELVANPAGREPDAPADQPHVCDPATLAAVRVVAETTKPCPNCARPIARVAGCAQMYCTICKTGFDWNSGLRVEINGYFHNPHYVEERAAARHGAPRAAQNDNIRHMDVFLARMRTRFLWMLNSGVIKRSPTPPTGSVLDLTIIYYAYSAAIHLESVNEANERALARGACDNLDIRAMYAAGLITGECFAALVVDRRRFLDLVLAERAALRAMRARVLDIVGRLRLPRTFRIDVDYTAENYGYIMVHTARCMDPAARAAAARECAAEIVACQAALVRAAAAAGLSPVRVDGEAGIRDFRSMVPALEAIHDRVIVASPDPARPGRGYLEDMRTRPAIRVGDGPRATVARAFSQFIDIVKRSHTNVLREFRRYLNL